MPRTRHCALSLAVWLLATVTAWADPFTYLSRQAWTAAVGVQNAPEPATLLLIGGGLAFIATILRVKR